jgi:carbonic anhydrase/acetyltransferase-like protein (isoleucine patch superfamily)
MKALLIAPADRPAVAALAEHQPLALVTVLGKPLLAYWLEQLADLGIREIKILAADRPDQVRAFVGDGARWGLEVEVIPALRELTVVEARGKYRPKDETDWPTAQLDVILMDRFPGLPNLPLFDSYSGWMTAVQAWLPHSALRHRVGVREVQPGVWAGLRSRISPAAKLHGPCWIGENAWVGANTTVGPYTVLENRVVVESGVEVSHSLVGPDTLLGHFTEVKDSLASGSTLVNWRSGSRTTVPDAFLMCSLKQPERLAKAGNVVGRSLAALLMLVSAPIAALFILAAKMRNQPSLRELRAVRPQGSAMSAPHEMVRYYELAGARGWFRMWPQLWNIVRGDFAWVGNRPLGPAEVAQLESEFDRLWLAAPIGLISLADAEGVAGTFTDDARACASFYAVRASWRLDLSILARTILP